MALQSPNQSLEPTAGHRDPHILCYETVQRVCRARCRQRWLSFVSLGVWQAQSRAGVYAEASAIVYTVGQGRGVTAIAKIAGGLVLLRTSRPNSTRIRPSKGKSLHEVEVPAELEPHVCRTLSQRKFLNGR
jgi:hypothetical protein